MKKRLIYLQSGFWRKIRSCNSVEEKRLFWDFYGALECGNIISDIPSNDWSEDKDDLLYYLLQNSVDGYGTIIERCSSQDIQNKLALNDEPTTESLCAVYLLDEDFTVCKDWSEKWGVLCLNSETIKHVKFLRGGVIEYEKDENSDSFEKCKPLLSSPCNSMLLIDPYILSSKWSVELNLIPLLDKCLPPDPKNQEDQITVFHLSILSQTNECKMGKYKDMLRYEEIFEYVYKEIRKIRPKMKMFFTLYHINTTGNGDGDFHSRHIVTNCMLINSEDGFDIFRSKKNETSNKWYTVSGKNARFEFVFPILSDDRRKDADNYYRWIKLAANNPLSESMSWGARKNRLFDLMI